jgi:hypothetical protein
MHTSLVCIPSHMVCEGSFEGTESVLIVLGSVLKALVRLLPSPSRYPSLCVCVCFVGYSEWCCTHQYTVIIHYCGVEYGCFGSVCFEARGVNTLQRGFVQTCTRAHFHSNQTLQCKTCVPVVTLERVNRQ